MWASLGSNWGLVSGFGGVGFYETQDNIITLSISYKSVSGFSVRGSL